MMAYVMLSDFDESAPRCDQCDRTIWCTEVHDGGYVFCSTDCRDAGLLVDDNVARTETGAEHGGKSRDG